MRRKQRGRTWGKGKEKKRERGRKRETEGRDRREGRGEGERGWERGEGQRELLPPKKLHSYRNNEVSNK